MIDVLIAAAMVLPAADHAPAACAAVAAPPAELAGWDSPRPATAGRSAVWATPLTRGVAVTARLSPSAAVRYAVRPEKPGGAASYGGVFVFSVTEPGRYRIALGSGAWIDVLAGGRAAASVAHRHGPSCTGVRKMVDFDLAPGRYVLQVAGNDGAELTLMVAKVTA